MYEPLWLLALDDFVLADYGIPPATLTDQSSSLSFGVDRRAGVSSSVYFSSSSQPASWHVIVQCPDEMSRNALIAVLAARRGGQVRLLAQRSPYGEDLITTKAAILSAPPHGSSDNIEVTFESDDSVWFAEDVVTVSKAFSSSLDQTMHLPVGGNVPTHPIVRLLPTAQRTSFTVNVGWRYRQRWTITNNGDEPLFRYPVRLSIGDTAALVTAGKAQADGDDLRVWLDGLEQSRTLINWNTTVSYVWLIVPLLPVEASLTYDLVYGNPSATADHGCDLAYPDLPAFELASASSSNAVWKYLTFPQADRAGKGLWVLTSPDSGGTPDFTVPGSWRPALTFENPTNTDEYFQGPARRLIVDEVQTITVSGTVSGGTYTITVAEVSETTAAIAYNADTATIQAALDALSSINPGDIVVGGGVLPGTPATLNYRGRFLGQDVAQITINSASLTGGGSYVPATTTAGDSWYQATFNAARWRGTPFYADDNGVLGEFAGSYPYDGVVLHNPFGIEVFYTNGFVWTNFANTLTVVTTTVGSETASDEVLVSTDPATQLVIIGRQSGGDDWHVIERRTYEAFAQQFSTLSSPWTPPEPMKHIGIACWPYSGPSIPDDIEGGVNGLLYGDTWVAIDTAGKLVITQTEAETDIYELATELRLHGGANAVGHYSTLLIGNARGLSGPGTPRAAVKLAQQGLQIDAERNTHTLWDTAFLTEDEPLSTHAVRGLSGYLHDGETGEVRDSHWLSLAPPRRTVANGAFDTDLSSWELYDDGTGTTYTATHDATIGGEQVGSLKIDITVNTGSDAISYLNSQFFGVYGQEAEEMSAWVRSSDADIHPRLFIAWYNGASDTPIAISNDPAWDDDPVADAEYTRSFAAVVPEGATRFRLGVAADANVSAAIGTCWLDDVRMNDNELFVADSALGAMTVAVSVRPRWVP